MTRERAINWILGVAGGGLVAWGIYLYATLGTPSAGEVTPVDCVQLGGTILVAFYAHHVLHRRTRIGDLDRKFLSEELTSLREDVAIAMAVFGECCEEPEDPTKLKRLLGKLKEMGVRINVLDIVMDESGLRLQCLSGWQSITGLFIDLRKATTASLPKAPKPTEVISADVCASELRGLLVRAQVELHRS